MKLVILNTSAKKNSFFILLCSRTIDGRGIAEYRAPAEVTGIVSAHGGKALAIASQDGCLTVLNIVDPYE